MAVLLFCLGGLLSLYGGVWFLVLVFKESVGWGLACLFLPVLSWVYLIMNFSDVKNPFFLQLAGTAIYIIGFILFPDADPGAIFVK